MDRSSFLLVTGGSGFVGRSFLQYLSEKPKEYIPNQIGLTSRSTPVTVPKALSEKTEIVDIFCDLEKPWQFDFAASHIVHLAADGSERSYTTEAGQTFIEMTTNLGEWSKKLKFPTIFHASSGAVYAQGRQQTLSKIQNDKNKSKDSVATFSETKRQFVRSRIIAEEKLQHLNDNGDINLRIGRLFSFIGAHLKTKPQYAINSFLEMARTGEIIISGNPNTTRGYLGAEDMSNWIYRTLSQDVETGIFDIGSSTPVTMREIANFIGLQLGARVAILNPESELDYYLAKNDDTLKKLKVSVTTEWQDLITDYLK